MEKLLSTTQIHKILDELVDKIYSDIPKNDNFAVVGIRSRGEILAGRISQKLSKKSGRDILCGTLDITLYRDDFNAPHSATRHKVQATEISFDVEGKFILLVDDVLQTGRSVRAAMDALMDLGRPGIVRLAVLIDRGMPELPIRADYVGIHTDIPAKQSIKVYLQESDDREEVIIE